MENKISFIIPVYNCEKYVNRLVESIIREKDKNIEIIILNDGSTDNTSKVLKKYCANKLIKIINKDNSGVSDTRNIGLSLVTGDYILFADSDDSYSKGFIKKIRSYLNNDFDLLIFGAYKEEQDKKLNEIFVQKNEEVLLNKNAGLQGYLKDDYTIKYGDCIWNKLYKASIIKENNILFKTNQSMAEDKLFNIEYFEHVKKILTIKDYIYIYCFNDNSVTHKYRDKFLDEYLKIGNNVEDIAKVVKYNNYYYLISYFYLQSIGFIMYNELLNKDKDLSRQNLKRYFENQIFKISLKNTNPFQFSFKNMLKYFMVKLNLYGLVYSYLYWQNSRRKNEK